MTHAISYSTSFGTDANDPLGLFRQDEAHYTPRYLSDHTTQVLDNLACSLQRLHDAASDRTEIFLMAGLIVGLLSMAGAIGSSLFL